MTPHDLIAQWRKEADEDDAERQRLHSEADEWEWEQALAARAERQRSCADQLAACLAAAEGQAVEESMADYLRQPHRKPVVDWLLSRGYVESQHGGALEIAWSHRSGYDFALLRFWPIARHAEDASWLALVGCHASGTNPIIEIGECETLDEVQQVHDLIRRINGYKQPEPERAGRVVPSEKDT